MFNGLYSQVKMRDLAGKHYWHILGIRLNNCLSFTEGEEGKAVTRKELETSFYQKYSAFDVSCSLIIIIITIVLSHPIITWWLNGYCSHSLPSSHLNALKSATFKMLIISDLMHPLQFYFNFNLIRVYKLNNMERNNQFIIIILTGPCVCVVFPLNWAN